MQILEHEKGMVITNSLKSKEGLFFEHLLAQIFIDGGFTCSIMHLLQKVAATTVMLKKNKLKFCERYGAQNLISADSAL